MSGLPRGTRYRAPARLVAASYARRAAGLCDAGIAGIQSPDRMLAVTLLSIAEELERRIGEARAQPLEALEITP